MNISQSMKGFVIYHFLYVGIKSGIFDFISSIENKGINAEQISKSLSLKSDYVQIWLNTGLSFEYFEFKDSLFFLKEEFTNFLLDKNNPKYQGELIQIFVEHLSNDMKSQVEYMKTGKLYTFSEHKEEFINLISKRGTLRVCQ